MSKKKSQKIIKDIFEGTASANECTGLYQKVSLDADEIAEFHKQFNDDVE